MQANETLLLLYDGNCPVCCWKVAFLKRRDRKNRLRFADINQPNAIPESVTVAFSELTQQIYALKPDGQLIGGMDVIRAAYREIGIGWIAAPTGWPLLRPLFDRFYRSFAKNRYRISRFFKDP